MIKMRTRHTGFIDQLSGTDGINIATQWKPRLRLSLRSWPQKDMVSINYEKITDQIEEKDYLFIIYFIIVGALIYI